VKVLFSGFVTMAHADGIEPPQLLTIDVPTGAYKDHVLRAKYPQLDGGVLSQALSVIAKLPLQG
jgi:hypothetical protein